jgi:hypothetical protein
MCTPDEIAIWPAAGEAKRLANPAAPAVAPTPGAPALPTADRRHSTTSTD